MNVDSRCIQFADTSFVQTQLFVLALGLTQPPIQWVAGALSLGVKR